SELTNDPYNVIITGVGGQGNVLASKVLGNILASRGLDVTIGETFGASQRGGSVMSHLRISATSSWSPQIPQGMAHVIIAIEPIEALRVLSVYGNPETLVISNDRPVHPVGVISGEMDYPEHDDIRRWLTTFSRASYIIPATDEAVKLGAPILGNIILLGALSETHTLPFGRADFSEVISLMMPADKVEANLKAFDLGTQMVN
ncbi:MAG: indolepyruvate oxidoreductase subunit beta, partial [Deltaproteobacteria bacterium]|nr:indolepyruvate oxidoreductase subunit beta [Deltaproteobacteria bacterium]